MTVFVTCVAAGILIAFVEVRDWLNAEIAKEDQRVEAEAATVQSERKREEEEEYEMMQEIWKKLAEETIEHHERAGV